ncbi:hypothetical protein CMEL01_03836 [Colletotrichum melonis]|uniref:Uncharacterized protein n=1 Tax=Colletotrichum melonis TaxID=1209925 RepID=A0AAI9UB38_9PEZI|nr:hypothetical protein CMEL01_03836 [Colletotrichum melonis]
MCPSEGSLRPASSPPSTYSYKLRDRLRPVLNEAKVSSRSSLPGIVLYLQDREFRLPLTRTTSAPSHAALMTCLSCGRSDLRIGTSKGS